MYSIEKIWPEWKAVRLIGEGSSGKVYEIVRNKLGIEEHSALKVISVPNSQSEINSLFSDGMDEQSVVGYYDSIVQSFVSEISLMSKLKGHPNIVTYEDYQVVKHDNGIGYDILIRMELLTPFSDIIRQNKFDTKNILDFALQLCEALSVCHKNNILHRDIKYDNIFVSNIGTYKLGDFGVARKFDKTSGNFSLKGTYTYMAPEIYKGQAYGATSDIYSLGIVLYRLMNKNREAFMPLPPNPIRLDDKEKALFKRMSGEKLPAPVDASKEIASIILKACAFNQSERYSSADELKADLLKCQQAVLSDNVVQNSYVNDIPKEDKTVSIFDKETVTSAPVTSSAAQDITPDYGYNDKTVSVYDTNRAIGNTDIENANVVAKLEHKKKSKKTAIVVSVIAVIALIVTAVVLFFVFNGNDNKKTDTSDVNNKETVAVDNSENNQEETPVDDTQDSDTEVTQDSEYDEYTQEISKGHYEDGLEYLSAYAKDLSSDALENAISSFKAADGYDNTNYYLNIANLCKLTDTSSRVTAIQKFAGDDYVDAILENDKHIQYFLDGSTWDDGSHYFKMTESSFDTDYNLPSFGYENADKNNQIYYYYIGNATYTAYFKDSDPIKFWKFSIESEYEVSVYCYETKETLLLNRYEYY